MNEILTKSVFFGMFLTLVCYEIGLWVKKKTRLSVANPLLIATLIIIAVLIIVIIDMKKQQHGNEDRKSVV